MASPRRIDVHFHLIPPFYREAVYAAGRGPAIGRYPDWTPQLALELMDRFGIEVALTSLAQPGVGFGTAESAQALARRRRGAAGGGFRPRRGGAGAGPPLQRLCRCVDRQPSPSVRRLRHRADVE